jgi:hypothetical protein
VKIRNAIIEEVESHACDVLVSATGVPSSWKMPEVDMISLFKRLIAHSAT